jgi:hypothetical protein
MRKAHGKIETLYESKGAEIHISSRRDGVHMNGSLHPDGNAEDIIDRGKIVKIGELREVLNKLAARLKVNPRYFQIVEYDWGYHLEWDPT